MHASTPRHPGARRPTPPCPHPPTARRPRPTTARLHAVLLAAALAVAAAPALPLAAAPPGAPGAGVAAPATAEDGLFARLADGWLYWAERLFGGPSPMDAAADPAPPAGDEPNRITAEDEPPKHSIGPSLDPNGLK